MTAHDDAQAYCPIPLEMLCERAALMCREVAAHEMQGLPIYIILQSRIQQTFPICTAGGWTSSSLDLYCQPHLDWRGRGPAMVINDQLQARYLSEAKRYPTIRENALWAGICESVFVSSFLSTVIHELAHIVTRREILSKPIDALEIGRCLESARQWIGSDVKTAVPWEGHGLDFIRSYLHLEARATRLGWPIVHNGTCAGAGYGLSSLAQYRTALGNEPTAMRQLAFRCIIDTPPPRAFLELHAMDTLVRDSATGQAA